MKRPKLPKSKIECPDCTRASGFPIGEAKGFSRRRFLQVGATGIVASYFLDVVNPKLLYGATKAPNVYLRNTARNVPSRSGCSKRNPLARSFCDETRWLPSNVSTSSPP